MQATGDLVTLASELAAGVQHGEHDLGCGEVFVGGMFVHGNAATVVDDLTTAIGTERDHNAGAVTRHRFIDSVVDDLVDEVVQAGRPRRTDVHARPFANGFETFENLDVLSVVRHVLP